MKAALLISGYLRTIEANLLNIKENIINRFDVCDVYLHITKSEKKDDRYMNDITDEKINSITSFLKPVAVLQEENQEYSEDKAENVLYNQWMKLYKLNKLKSIKEETQKYDIVIRCRPDFNLISEVPFHLAIENPETIFIPKDDKIDKAKLSNVNDLHVCDIFGFGSSYIMNSYFPSLSCIEKGIKEVGCVPETFFANHIKNLSYQKIDVDYCVLLSNCNIFAIAGDSGSGKSTLADMLKTYFNNSFVLECDRYHKWERGNEMWKKMTHLNPESNFLSKMSEDIFDLKIGNTIYQVDYDHKNGKFTEKEAIPSKDNIIVCGLHSLYPQNDQVYNLTVFMDTDERLKRKWKIKRDTKKRGYSVEKILEQIQTRISDYQQYIEPQKYQSDVIINFYTDSDFDINNLDKEDNVGLRIHVLKKYSLQSFIAEIVTENIQFDLSETKDRNILTFPMVVETQEKIKDFYAIILSLLLRIRI